MRRIPVSERLAELNAAPSATTPEAPDLTDASSIGLFPTFNVASEALTVTQAGELEAVRHVAAVDHALLTWDDAVAIPLDQAMAHHLLVVGDDVDARELEALAMSVWEDAGWIGPGELRLTGGARLTGPWRLTTGTRQALKTPANLIQAWVVEVDESRTNPAPVELRATNPLTACFPDAMPAGEELRVLHGLERISRRLAGAIRIHDSGMTLEPDADSAVTMTVYAGRWVDESDLMLLLRPYFPDIVNAINADRLVPMTSSSRARRRDELARSITIPADERERIARITAQADRKALAEGFVVRGYSLLASAGNTSRIHITVAPAQHIPTALRFELWPDGAPIEYGIRWIAPEHYRERPARPSRALRLERLRVKEQIEDTAVRIARSTGGHILDEDQFIVSLRRR